MSAGQFRKAAGARSGDSLYQQRFKLRLKVNVIFIQILVEFLCSQCLEDLQELVVVVRSAEEVFSPKDLSRGSQ